MEAFSGQFSTISDQENRISAGIWGGLLIIPSMVSSRFCRWNPSRFQQHTLIRAHPDILQKIKKVSLGTRNVYIYIYNNLGSGFLCSLLVCSSSTSFIFSCLCLQVEAARRWWRGGMWEEVVGAWLRISQILYWMWVESAGSLACGFTFSLRILA